MILNPEPGTVRPEILKELETVDRRKKVLRAIALHDEAGLKLQHANEILSHGHLFPGSFNSVEIRSALQEASEAVVILAELDLLLK
jgi:hypothetical protein